MKEQITEIIGIEWEMFHSTSNIGGQAACQQDRAQFELMRSSQFLGWNEESLRCYLEDLHRARASGVNLVAVKYAYMMERTAPEEYAGLAAALPPVTPERMALVERLTALTMRWCEDFAAAYPKLSRMGRPLHSSSDTPASTSVETYSRGELMTYGAQTLQALLAHYQALDAAGRNLHREVLENEVRQLGYASLEAAEKSL